MVIVGEVIDFRVAAWARGGRAAFLLLRAAYEAFCAHGVDWISALSASQNRATLPLVARRAGFPKLVALGGFASVHFIGWRVPSLVEPNGLTVRAATAADATMVAELSAEALGGESALTGGADRGGRTRLACTEPGSQARRMALCAACCWSGTAKQCAAFGFFAIGRPTCRFDASPASGAWLGMTSPLPSPGGVLGLWASRVVTIRHGGSVTLRALLRAALRDAAVAGRSVVQLNLHGLDPLLRELPKYPSSIYRSTLYGCPWRSDSVDPSSPAERYYADLARA